MTINSIIHRTRPSLISFAILLARLSIGTLLFVAGGGKVFGWFGYGLHESVEGYAKSGFTALWAYLSIFTEFIGGLLLVIGLLTRPAAFAIMINMTVATIVLLPAGILGPGGAHIPYLYLVIDIIILLIGPMDYSLDRLIFNKNGRREQIYQKRY